MPNTIVVKFSEVSISENTYYYNMIAGVHSILGSLKNFYDSICISLANIEINTQVYFLVELFILNSKKVSIASNFVKHERYLIIFSLGNIIIH